MRRDWEDVCSRDDMVKMMISSTYRGRIVHVTPGEYTQLLFFLQQLRITSRVMKLGNVSDTQTHSPETR